MQQEPCQDVCIESAGTGVWVSVVFDSSEKNESDFQRLWFLQYEQIPKTAACHSISLF